MPRPLNHLDHDRNWRSAAKHKHMSVMHTCVFFCDITTLWMNLPAVLSPGSICLHQSLGRVLKRAARPVGGETDALFCQTETFCFSPVTFLIRTPGRHGQNEPMETEKAWHLEEYKQVWTFSWMPRLFLLYCMAFSLTTLKSQLHKRRHAPPETGPVSSTKLFWKDLDMLRRRKRKTDLSAFPSGINLTYCGHVILLHRPLLLFPCWTLSHNMQIFKPQHIYIGQGNNYSHWLELYMSIWLLNGKYFTCEV